MGPRSNLLGVALATIVTVIVGAIVTVGLGTSAPRGGESAHSAQQPAPVGDPVRIGGDYYVSVSLVEVSERDPEGKPWDSLTESGPDISVEILWKGNRIYRSTTKDDTFVAKWSTGEIHLGQMALAGGTTSLDDLVQAARLNIRADESITVRVSDSDIITHTVIGEKTFTTTDLRVGETVSTFDPPGIVRIALRVNDMAETVDILK